MNSEELIQKINQESEMNPDAHDGSYELMREIIASYSTLEDYSVINFKDLNAIYAMAIGTFKMNVEKKKDYINDGHLPDGEKTRMAEIIDRIWDNACFGKYENRENDRPSVGMFGTGFYSFERNADDASCQSFIKMMIDISTMDDDEQIYKRCDLVFDENFKGMQAAAASVMLHCLKPFTFPILNANYGFGTIYDSLRIMLDKPGKIDTYISNCRTIKSFRDKYLSFKNYRILDLYPHKHDISVDGNNSFSDNDHNSDKLNINKNTILYGPPGTGKTYNTVLYAVSIIEKKSLSEIKAEAAVNYEAVKQRYDLYKSDDRIAFVTFHQSYGYEEFIEGIKPVVDADDSDEEKLEYTIESGVFKKFCEKAGMPKKNNKDSYELNSSPCVWKVSLERTYENPTRRDCLDNNHIRIGWDEYGEELADNTDYYNGGKAILNSYYNRMKIGDLVLSCYSATQIDAIGIVTSDCYWDKKYSYYRRVRDVKWLVKDIREDILDINGGKTLVLSTVYRLNISPRDVLALVNKNLKNDDPELEKNDDNYVFIIDEINRGNISKIFGELITLIEETKRLGAPEETTVKLPYSPTSNFGIPQNVYLLGTMNTADRSIALMDTALRRRFSFEEMMPDPSVLDGIVVTDNGKSLNVSHMLKAINDRIEFLYDREHTIGHAFFTRLKESPDIETLADIFKKSVIPLLQEYFYEDYSKIQLVLGDDGKRSDDKKIYQFIRDEEVKPSDLFYTNPDMESSVRYEIQESALHRIESYKMIAKNL